MNKKDFIAGIAEKSGLPEKDAGAALSAAIEVLTETLKKGDSVQLIGFATFSVSEKPERTVRNPKTGAEMKTPASRNMKVKAGKKLKEALNS